MADENVKALCDFHGENCPELKARYNLADEIVLLKKKLEVSQKRCEFLFDKSIRLEQQIETLKRTIELMRVAAIAVDNIK